MKDIVIGKKTSDEEKLANLFREQGSAVKHKEVTSDWEVGKGEYTWDAKHFLEELPHFEEIYEENMPEMEIIHVDTNAIIENLNANLQRKTKKVVKLKQTMEKLETLEKVVKT